jgi:hypothetical protein
VTHCEVWILQRNKIVKYSNIVPQMPNLVEKETQCSCNKFSTSCITRVFVTVLKLTPSGLCIEANEPCHTLQPYLFMAHFNITVMFPQRYPKCQFIYFRISDRYSVSLFSLFWKKIEVGLCDHHVVCLCIAISILNGWTNLSDTWYVYHDTWAHLKSAIHKSLP